MHPDITPLELHYTTLHCITVHTYHIGSHANFQFRAATQELEVVSGLSVLVDFEMQGMGCCGVSHTMTIIVHHQSTNFQPSSNIYSHSTNFLSHSQPLLTMLGFSFIHLYPRFTSLVTVGLHRCGTKLPHSLGCRNKLWLVESLFRGECQPVTVVTMTTNGECDDQ